MKIIEEGRIVDCPDLKFAARHEAEQTVAPGSKPGDLGAKPFQARDGNMLNELMLNNPAVPLQGGPLDGTVIHQPQEVFEVEFPVRDALGKVTGHAKYRREGDKIGEPKYVFVKE